MKIRLEKNNSKEYKAGFIRLVALLWLQLAIVISFFLIYLFGNDKASIVLTALFFFFIYIIPGIILAINHWRFSRHMILREENKNYTLLFDGKKFNFTNQDIVEIISFETGSRSPWSTFKFWKLNIGKETFFISNLLVPHFAFEGYFWNKIREEKLIWPIMRKNKADA